jgi:hypothetical protein
MVIASANQAADEPPYGRRRVLRLVGGAGHKGRGLGHAAVGEVRLSAISADGTAGSQVTDVNLNT